MPTFSFVFLMSGRTFCSSSNSSAAENHPSRTFTLHRASSSAPPKPASMDCNHNVARSIVGIELRSWSNNGINGTTIFPRTRHICGETSWENLHHIAYTTFGADRTTHKVHFHRDSFRDPACPTNKPRLNASLWATGIYHGVALRICGDHKFVVYAHFVKKEEFF